MNTRVLWIGMAVVGAIALASWWSARRPALREAAEPEPSAESAAPPRAAPPAAPAPTPPAQPDAGAPTTVRRAPADASVPLAPGQALREVRALVDQRKIGAARALAERYLNQMPDGEEAGQIKSLTGVHPHP